MDGQVDGNLDSQAGRYTDIQIERKTGIKIEGEIDRQNRYVGGKLAEPPQNPRQY